jgi:hypothetical protein
LYDQVYLTERARGRWCHRTSPALVLPNCTSFGAAELHLFGAAELHLYLTLFALFFMQSKTNSNGPQPAKPRLRWFTAHAPVRHPSI